MIIAIKGRIGTGKTTVSNKISEKYNFKIINGDNVVKEMYKSNEKLINLINSEFSLSGDVVDTKSLGEIVFNDEQKLKQLETIVHPYLSERINQFVKENNNVIIDAQVIDKLNVSYDYVILCSANEDDIIKRVKIRDGRDEEQIKNILQLQLKGHMLKKRTYVINTSNEDVDVQIEKVMKGFYDCENWENSEYS